MGILRNCVVAESQGHSSKGTRSHRPLVVALVIRKGHSQAVSFSGITGLLTTGPKPVPTTDKIPAELRIGVHIRQMVKGYRWSLNLEDCLFFSRALTSPTSQSLIY